VRLSFEIQSLTLAASLHFAGDFLTHGLIAKHLSKTLGCSDGATHPTSVSKEFTFRSVSYPVAVRDSLKKWGQDRLRYIPLLPVSIIKERKESLCSYLNVKTLKFIIYVTLRVFERRFWG
jgi:hypothetical protein